MRRQPGRCYHIAIGKDEKNRKCASATFHDTDKARRHVLSTYMGIIHPVQILSGATVRLGDSLRKSIEPEAVTFRNDFLHVSAPPHQSGLAQMHVPNQACWQSALANTMNITCQSQCPQQILIDITDESKSQRP